MPSTASVLKQLRALADPAARDGMARFGMNVTQRLGVSVPNLRRLAKELGPDHPLALRLWRTGYAEARIVASMIAVPDQMRPQDMDAWAADFDSWDVCDQVCMNLFEKTPYAYSKVDEWSGRDDEFVKRAAFALLACLAWHDKQADDQVFLPFLPVIQRGATDQRNFVKKAVSWALRNIGKRSRRLNQAAIQTARQLQQVDSKAARWVAADALRELKGAGVQKRLKG